MREAAGSTPSLDEMLALYDAEAPLERAATLPSAWYLDAAIHERERERIFFRTWQAVGHVGQVARPGAFFTIDLAGEPLVVARDEAGSVRAFYNVCRHRGAVVARGEGCAASLNCPYHGWVYGLDGRLRGGPPEFEGVEGFERGRNGLTPVRADTFGPFVFVNLDPAAPPLIEALRDLAALVPPAATEGRTFFERRTYEVACNWKVYIDNYLEAYHVPHVHPSLSAVLDYASYVTEPRGACVLQATPTRAAPRAARAGAELDLVSTYAPPGSEARYVWCFPTFLVNVYDNALSGNYILPLGKDRTLCIFDFFFRSPEGAKESVAASHAIQLEDMEICAAVQRGIASRSYRQGRYSLARENGLHHFHRLLARALR